MEGKHVQSFWHAAYFLGITIYLLIITGHLLWHCTDGTASRQAISPLTMSASPALQQMQNRCLVICAGYLRCCCYLITCSSRMKYLPLQQFLFSRGCVCLLWTWSSVVWVFFSITFFFFFLPNSRWFLPRNGSPEKPMMTLMTWLFQLLFSRWLLDSRGYSPSIIYRRNLWLWENTGVWLIARSMLVLSDALVLWMGELCRKLFFLETSWKENVALLNRKHFWGNSFFLKAYIQNLKQVSNLVAFGIS